MKGVVPEVSLTNPSKPIHEFTGTFCKPRTSETPVNRPHIVPIRCETQCRTSSHGCSTPLRERNLVCTVANEPTRPARVTGVIEDHGAAVSSRILLLAAIARNVLGALSATLQLHGLALALAREIKHQVGDLRAGRVCIAK
jgi:hypothetical protein